MVPTVVSSAQLLDPGEAGLRWLLPPVGRVVVALSEALANNDTSHSVHPPRIRRCPRATSQAREAEPAKAWSSGR
jgi:hypothetical protein